MVRKTESVAQMRNSLRKRRQLLLRELGELEARQEAITEYRQVITWGIRAYS